MLARHELLALAQPYSAEHRLCTPNGRVHGTVRARPDGCGLSIGVQS